MIGGWTYSTDGIDVDGDGATDGEYDIPAVQGENTSDGFVIKLDKNGDVEYSSTFQGDGYEGVTAVAETTNGNIVSGGYFTTAQLSATNYKFNDTGEVKDGTIIDNGKGNSNGFIVSEFLDGKSEATSIAEAQYLEIENKLKSFKITTEVIKHDESGTQVAGGNVNGSEGTLEVEKVTYGESSTKEIKITPNAGYSVSSIKINGTEFTNYATNSDGTITLPLFENVTEDKNITVEFSKTIGTIEVNHYLWNGQATTEKVKESETLTGNVGETYTTLPATDIKYDIITNSDYYGTSLPAGIDGNDYYIPDNYQGTFVSGKNTPVNYYYKYKQYTVTFNYYLEGTTQKIPNKNYTDGTAIEPDVQTITKDQTYTHNLSTIQQNNIDTTVYELVGNYENYGLRELNGQYVYEVKYENLEANLEVNFYYRIKTVNLSFTKVAEEDKTVTIADTEFSLFKRKANITTEDKLIKVKDEKSWENEWEKINTYTTTEDGKVNLTDLPINGEYRLVETKSAEGRLIADGQWKIEFMYGNYDKNDETIITVNGMDLKITSVGGNPPAFAITEQGSLQLPNRKYFDFPTSGSFGSKNIYQIGLTVITIGLLILLCRKYLLIRVNTKNKIEKPKHTTKKANIVKAQHIETLKEEKPAKKKKATSTKTTTKKTGTSTKSSTSKKSSTRNTKNTTSNKRVSNKTNTTKINIEEPQTEKTNTNKTTKRKSTSTNKTRAKKGKHSKD